MYDTYCLDENGEVTYSLTQWDANRKLGIKIEDNLIYNTINVHLFNNKSKTAYVVAGSVSGQTVSFSVPNILLTESLAIHIFVCLDNDDIKKVIKSARIPVKGRKKPSDYIYTETEVLTWKSLEERIQYLEEYGTGGGGISGGTNDHTKLKNRNSPDQHSIDAITNLRNELNNKQPKGDYLIGDIASLDEVKSFLGLL